MARDVVADDTVAVDLLTRVVGIRSVSGEEREVACHLAAAMRGLGFESQIDESGSVVGIAPYEREGELPPIDIVLLGHMDTVPGDVPVRREGDLLFGRGSVDAKGPLSAFVMAAARARLPRGVRLVVIGATEEEASSSKGATFAATQWRPAACIIGEPSHWDGVTLGYKGCARVEYAQTVACSHSAGPDPSGADLVCAWWERVRARIGAMNGDRRSPFEVIQATMRHMTTISDGLHEEVRAGASFRLPLGVTPEMMVEVCRGVAEELGQEQHARGAEAGSAGAEVSLVGAEVAYAGSRDSALVRAFTTVIRGNGAAPHLRVKTGTSDMNVVGPVWKCPIVAYGPGDSSLDHTPNEHLSISEYLKAIEVLRAVIERVAGELAGARVAVG